jgi:ABC-type sugar transport system ATPase subunit
VIAPPATELLRAEGIGKSFGPVRALADVSLRVSAGEVVALAGENGSGKSTLARIIAGVLTADAGTVEFGGRQVSAASPRRALAAGVGLVSQEPTLVPHLSIAENILLAEFSAPGRLIRRSDLADRAAAHLDEVGLRVDPRRAAGSLGAGDLELVELAKALASSPRLLILDEVTARLPDPGRLFDVVRRCQERGVATILITHRLREIRQLAGRAAVLRDGRLVAELPRGELTDERIAAAMVGRELGEYFHKRQVVPGGARLEARGLVTDRSAHPVSVTVRAGEIVGVAGLVGAGRSELLETVAGARRARGGAILVDGAPVRIRRPRQAQQAGIVLVPEDRFSQGLSRAHSVRDNLATPWLRALARSSRSRDQARAAAAVRDYRIRCPDVHAPAGSLSGGNAQKVVLARAFQLAPKVLLLDEPTRGVDIGARSDIYSFLGGLAAQGTAILLASSDLLELLGLADRIVVLAEGRIAGELNRDSATEEAIALLALGGGNHDDHA